MQRKYKAVIIDGKKLIKTVVSAILGVCLVSVFTFGAKVKNLKFEYERPQITDDRNMHFALFLPWKTLSGEIPFLNNESGKTKAVFNESDGDKKVVLPQTGTVTALEGELPIRGIDSGQSSVIGNEKILINNGTNYSVSTAELLSEKLNIDMTANGPKVLIVHTHGSESYTAEGKTSYTEGTGDRNTDTNFNVVHVGDEMTKVFQKKGIEVIHDRTMHDCPSYNGSYTSSLEAIEQYKKKYPSIQIVFDVHRDAIVYSDGTKAKVVTEINGKNAAQLMFVVGTNEGGLKHDNWRENLKFAVQLQSTINKKYPSLMRGINLRRERFNGHTTKGSVIIEVGTSGNTLSEAVTGSKLAAEVIADFINGI